MNEIRDKITSRERLTARILRWAPWLSFFIVALPAPLVFFLLYLMSSVVENAAVYLLLAFSSLAVGAVAGVLAVIFLLLYRRRWERRLRDRLGADGVTVDELPYFMPELKPSERKALKAIEEQDPLLADAYRETLAARLTATRVVKSSKRNLLLVERHLNRASYIKGTDTSALLEELRADRARLERVKKEGEQREAGAVARLQTIEAAASRGTSWAETNFALQRLEAAQEQTPLALEAARLEQELREGMERELKESNKSLPG